MAKSEIVISVRGAPRMEDSPDSKNVPAMKMKDKRDMDMPGK